MIYIYKIAGLLAVLLLAVHGLYAQVAVQGKVTDEAGKPIANVSLKIEGTTLVHSGEDGAFKITVKSLPVEVTLSHVRFHEASFLLNKADSHVLLLKALDRLIEEVEVNTGYYRLPKERVTGSFTVVDREMLDLSVSDNILSRLEGLANSLYFDKRNVVGEEQGAAPNIRLRGLSTIEGNTAPLVVVDDFPFYGDINDINPNDVESVSILRDASASSIWGAQAGNGVIVITTKKAQYNSKLRLGYGTNLSFGRKPDLYYDQNYLPPEVLMSVQKELFERKAYTENDRTRLPAYVELLIARRDGKVGEEAFLKQEAFYKQNDLRKDYLTHLYRLPSSQRHSLYFNQGGENMTMGFSLNADENLHTLRGNANKRLNLGLQITAKLLPKLETHTAVWYSRLNGQNNGEGYSRSAGRYMYESLYDLEGSQAHIGLAGGYRLGYAEKGADEGLLLDWKYRPIEEVGLKDMTNLSADWRMTQQFRYSLAKGLDLLANYQYVEGRNKSENLYDKDSFYARNLVNRFTQADGKRIIPYGAIYDLTGHSFSNYHGGRLQVNFNRELGKEQWFSGLVGGEISQNLVLVEPTFTFYGYDKESWVANFGVDDVSNYPTRPSGTARVSPGRRQRNRLRDRNISYFSNFGYGLQGKYTASASFRWDGSNLLGVKINDKGTLLWSAGLGWDMMKESFMQATWLESLKWRLTYGVAGNIDKSQSHYPTLHLASNSVSGLPMATVLHAGNPSLSWEKVATLNFALDWSMLNGALQGTADYYIKNASNLLGNVLVDPSTGVGANYKVNYADMRTTGLDFQLNSQVRLSKHFSWLSTAIVNLSANKVTRFYGGNYLLSNYFRDPAAVTEGRSYDQVYAMPWHGLDSKNGMPLVVVDGELTSDDSKYRGYYSNYAISDLIVAGQSVPRVFGSWLNRFSYRSFSLSGLLSFRVGHVFRRKSIAPGQEYVVSNASYHTDYMKRWKQAGDELHTNVPNALGNLVSFSIYGDTMALIEPADVVRLDNVQLSYTYDKRWLKRVRLYAQVDNLGIVWRANKLNLDPDYINAFYPPTRRITCGIQIDY